MDFFKQKKRQVIFELPNMFRTPPAVFFQRSSSRGDVSLEVLPWVMGVTGTIGHFDEESNDKHPKITKRKHSIPCNFFLLFQKYNEQLKLQQVPSDQALSNCQEKYLPRHGENIPPNKRPELKSNPEPPYLRHHCSTKKGLFRHRAH